MAGFQFVHIQGYSRKALAADAKGKGGRAAVRDVLAEAARLPGDAPHVAQPLPPVHVFGVPVGEVQSLHDAQCEAARTEVKGGKPRKVRQDQATLLTCIASFPATTAECAADPAKAAARDDWQRRNVEWAREVWGDGLVSVCRHDDEAHPHLHLLVLPGDPAMRANALHPGWMAKQEAKAAAEDGGLDGKAANKAGDRAYREAMRRFQDGYWRRVGLPCGLARIGPGKRSQPRAEWKAEQARAEQVGELVRAAEAAAAAVGAAAEQRAGLEALAASVAEQRLKAEAMAAQAAAAVAAARVEAERAKAEADAAVESARAEAGRLLAEAKRQAGEILSKARQQAERLVEGARASSRAVGAALGSVVFGLVGQSPGKVEARGVAAGAASERVAAEAREAALHDALTASRRENRGLRHELAEAQATIKTVAGERDELRTALASLPVPGIGRPFRVPS